MDLEKETFESTSVVEYVLGKRDEWENDYDQNYRSEHEEFYRIWRSKYDPQDSERPNERSKLISPATQQAVESSCSELEEATFGRGLWFDIKDDVADQEKQDIELVKNKLTEDFDNARIRRDISEVTLNAAVTGTGIGEIVMEEIVDRRPATRPAMEGQLTAYGVEESTRIRVRLRSVKPGNFLIDPDSTSIEDAVGVIIDEYVPRHQVLLLQESGVYKDCPLEPVTYQDTRLMKDPEIENNNGDSVRLTKYYGLVPSELLPPDEQDDSVLTEAVVIIANGSEVLKATANPYMMKDRPIVAFQWDIVPGRFWGRGVCEKAFMSQKALDTELRARADALALTVHPMMAMDANRVARGFRPRVGPGRTVLTNGAPKDILMPMNFGTLDTNSFTQTQILQDMVQQATGAVDSTGLLSSVSGEAKTGAVSMSLGAVIKRHKRTLINFQESFLLPFITKAAWRYMEFDPENYPVKDYKFVASSTLGIIAREYEVSQLISLLQTMSPDSPMYPALIRSIVDNMNLSNREQLIGILDQAAQPTPEQQEAQQKQQQMLEQEHMAKIGVFESQAAESNARAQKYQTEAELEPRKVMNDFIEAITAGMDSNEGDAAEFDRRMQILDRFIAIKEKATAPTGVTNGNNSSGFSPDSGGNQF